MLARWVSHRSILLIAWPILSSDQESRYHFSKLCPIICPLDSLSATRFGNIIHTVTAISLLCQNCFQFRRETSKVEKLDSYKKSHPIFYITLKSTLPLREPRCDSWSQKRWNDPFLFTILQLTLDNSNIHLINHPKVKTQWNIVLSERQFIIPK